MQRLIFPPQLSCNVTMQDFTVHWASTNLQANAVLFISMWLHLITVDTLKDQFDRTLPYFYTEDGFWVSRNSWRWWWGRAGDLYVKKLFNVSWNVSELGLLPLDLGIDANIFWIWKHNLILSIHILEVPHGGVFQKYAFTQFVRQLEGWQKAVWKNCENCNRGTKTHIC